MSSIVEAFFGRHPLKSVQCPETALKVKAKVVNILKAVDDQASFTLKYEASSWVLTFHQLHKITSR